MEKISRSKLETPNTLVGKDTRFKSHPNKVDHKFNKQSSKVDLKSSNSQVELTHNDVFDDDKQSTSLGSIIYNHSDVNK